ncbi:MAG: aldo/keto reductase [Bifidobacteriaceae bacterium]|nr:aldo/keto reductase [Bifidobacteriaceae bacterium]
MEHRNAGRSGLRLSAIGLGTMTWGRDTDEMDAADQLAEFTEAGGTFIDTAGSYGDGAAEELLGSLMRSGLADRDEVVIATKAGSRMRGQRLTTDASRGNLIDNLTESLRRLGTDHVDLLLVQRPDPVVPLEETLGALKWALDSGKTRYIGLSNHPAWVTARAQTLIEETGLGLGLAAVEVEYSLLNRRLEVELAPAAAHLGLGLLTWSPLGRGVLTGKYRHGVPADSRAASPHLRGFVAPYLSSAAAAVVEAVATAADGLGVAPLDIALAWVRGRAGVTSAILGARTAAQLHTALVGADLELPPEIVAALDEVSSGSL